MPCFSWFLTLFKKSPVPEKQKQLPWSRRQRIMRTALEKKDVEHI